MNKKIMILFILLVATGCNITSLNRTDNYVYITHQTYYDWQIWKVAIDGTENKMIYQLPRRITMTSSPGDKLFSENMKQQYLEEYSTAILKTPFNTWISVKLSPDRKLMAIRENFSYCPGNWCDGQSIVRIIDLETNKEISERVFRPSGYGQEWSNDESLLLFRQLHDENGIPVFITHVWDTQTAQEVFSFLGDSPFFIGQSHRIISKNYIENQETGEQDLSCCQIIDPLLGTVEMKSIVEETQYNPYHLYSLSSDGKRIALEVSLENSVEVKIAKINDLNFESTILWGDSDSYIGDIDWSSDDRLIAIDGGKNDERFLDVIDAKSGEVRYSLGEVEDWEWSSETQKILYFTENNEGTCIQAGAEINILDVKKGLITPVELPKEISDYIDNWDNDVICIRFIQDVTW